MPDLEDMTPGEILAEASVAEFIKSLGLGIAEAQQALDENSVDQIAEFVEPRESLGGRSLLDMGLSPAFYHYQYADITCQLQLSLRVEKDFSLALHIGGSLDDSVSGSSGELRQAELTIPVASKGALKVRDTEFKLSTTDTHLVRMQKLQKALLASKESTGIEMALFDIPDTNIKIELPDAIKSKVFATNNTIAITAQANGAGVIKISKNEKTTFKLNGTTDFETDVAGSLEDYAQAVLNAIPAGFIKQLVKPGDPYLEIKFKTSLDSIDDFELNDIAGKLSLFSGPLAESVFKAEIEGYADTQRYTPKKGYSSDEQNVDLGMRRANYIKQLLIANAGVEADGVINNSVEVSGGTLDAVGVGDQPGTDNSAFRKADVCISGDDYWIFIQGTTSELTDEGLDANHDNGLVYLKKKADLNLNVLNGQSLKVDGSDVALLTTPDSSPSLFAKDLETKINKLPDGKIKATAFGNIVSLISYDNQYKWVLATTDNKDISLSGTEGIKITKPFPKPTTSGVGKQKDKNRTVAFGASLDVAYATKNNTSVTGNSSITARLVSIPAPVQFLDEIKSYLSSTDSQ